jgi:hypothetical protein
MDNDLKLIILLVQNRYNTRILLKFKIKSERTEKSLYLGNVGEGITKNLVVENIRKE